MKKYIIWLTALNSDYKPFYIIVSAPDKKTAGENAKNDKKYQDIKILSIERF